LLSKRANEVLEKLRAARRPTGKVLHLAIDSTGLKVYGDGEWKTRIHGTSKRRTWRKMHLAIDTDSHKIVGALLTKSSMHDGKAMKRTLTGVKKIGFGYGDGAYDQIRCYEEFSKNGGKPVIPPRKGSKSREVWSIAEQLRDINVKASQDLGQSAWKTGIGYHRRSLVETAMGRFKNQFTGSLASRTLKNQKAEMEIKISILNQMTEWGMPVTHAKKSLPKKQNQACWRNASDSRRIK
jgi:hypothetical protein